MRGMKYTYVIIGFFIAIGTLIALSKTNEVLETSQITSNFFLSTTLVSPDATITGGGSSCQNAGSEVAVTFTGSGGISPYTFTYYINEGINQTETTAGSNDAITIDANTNAVGTFVYTLVSVIDSNGESSDTPGSVTVEILPSPDASLNGTGSGTTIGGIPAFTECVSSASGANSAIEFTFTNNTTTSVLNTDYTINWGDGSPDFNDSDWQIKSHTYAVGLYYLVYTVRGSNNCTTVTEYVVFVGSNPAVSLGNPGNSDICSGSPLNFPISGIENNPEGTRYEITFNDGSAPQVFFHPAPGEPLPTFISHTFTSSSCGESSSNGTNSFQNSFSATIIASNPCGLSSVGVVPIYVSTPAEADIEMPEIACTDTPVLIQNRSTGDQNNQSTCDVNPNIVWEISPSSGFTVAGGSLGNDFGSDDPDLWTTGSDNLNLNFSNSGTYTVILRTANKCGIDDLSLSFIKFDI
jgi:hypothetical protein